MFQDSEEVETPPWLASPPAEKPRPASAGPRSNEYGALRTTEDLGGPMMFEGGDRFSSGLPMSNDIFSTRYSPSRGPQTAPRNPVKTRKCNSCGRACRATGILPCGHEVCLNCVALGTAEDPNLMRREMVKCFSCGRISKLAKSLSAILKQDFQPDQYKKFADPDLKTVPLPLGLQTATSPIPRLAGGQVDRFQLGFRTGIAALQQGTLARCPEFCSLCRGQFPKGVVLEKPLIIYCADCNQFLCRRCSDSVHGSGAELEKHKTAEIFVDLDGIPSVVPPGACIVPREFGHVGVESGPHRTEDARGKEDPIDDVYSKGHWWRTGRAGEYNWGNERAHNYGGGPPPGWRGHPQRTKLEPRKGPPLILPKHTTSSEVVQLKDVGAAGTGGAQAAGVTGSGPNSGGPGTGGASDNPFFGGVVNFDRSSIDFGGTIEELDSAGIWVPPEWHMGSSHAFIEDYKCVLHPKEPVQYFCQTCDSIGICSQCCVGHGHHVGHKVLSGVEAMRVIEFRIENEIGNRLNAEKIELQCLEDRNLSVISDLKKFLTAAQEEIGFMVHELIDWLRQETVVSLHTLEETSARAIEEFQSIIADKVCQEFLHKLDCGRSHLKYSRPDTICHWYYETEPFEVDKVQLIAESLQGRKEVIQYILDWVEQRIAMRMRAAGFLQTESLSKHFLSPTIQDLTYLVRGADVSDKSIQAPHLEDIDVTTMMDYKLENIRVPRPLIQPQPPVTQDIFRVWPDPKSHVPHSNLFKKRGTDTENVPPLLGLDRQTLQDALVTPEGTIYTRDGFLYTPRGSHYSPRGSRYTPRGSKISSKPPSPQISSSSSSSPPSSSSPTSRSRSSSSTASSSSSSSEASSRSSSAISSNPASSSSASLSESLSGTSSSVTEDFSSSFSSESSREVYSDSFSSSSFSSGTIVSSSFTGSSSSRS